MAGEENAVAERVPVLDAIVALYTRQGALLFLGGAVSQTAHALQAAWLAEQAGAPPALIAAAFLHDIGHLLGESEDGTSHPASGHAALGADWLAPHFRSEIVEPIRLHVESKRYLCGVASGYQDRLMSSSRLSLERQGGPMVAAAAAQFRTNPWAESAIILRRWDDFARVPGLATPSLSHFMPFLRAALRPQGGAPGGGSPTDGVPANGGGPGALPPDLPEAPAPIAPGEPLPDTALGRPRPRSRSRRAVTMRGVRTT